MLHLSSDNKQSPHKLELKRIVLVLIVSTIIANAVIIFSDPHQRHSVILWTLIVTGGVASTLGIIAVCRYGLKGKHGKSYLFLTLGLISWFSAEITLTYYYYEFGIEEQKMVSFADFLWGIGYVFLALHLFIVLQSLHIHFGLKTLILPIIAIFFTTIYNMNGLTLEFLTENDIAPLAVTISYPILDLSLMIPSMIILLGLRKDYQHSIPWFFSSLSLLINAIADNGYVHDFVRDNSQTIWLWNLFYVTDFIIMSGALFWYNRFHISNGAILE